MIRLDIPLEKPCKAQQIITEIPPDTKLSPRIRNAVTPGKNISSDGANADINCTGNILAERLSFNTFHNYLPASVISKL